ncbi:MAG: glycerol-3-phosphate responsive antiterminator [Erysipelotrichaceae bacterium]
MQHKQPIIPAITNMKNFERFLRSSCVIGVILDMHINFLADMVNRAHLAGKQLYVHIDLLKGVSSDEYGVEFLVQSQHVDGILSTKPRVLEAAKKNGVVAIQRVFLIDHQSLQKAMVQVNKTKPDFVEMLPALAPQAIALLQAATSVPVIGGGLLQNKEQIQTILDAGAQAVTTSNHEFW